jgi:hypothetical protein
MPAATVCVAGETLCDVCFADEFLPGGDPEDGNAAGWFIIVVDVGRKQQIGWFP